VEPVAGTTLHHVLFYDYVENIVERRTPHREEHLKLVSAWREDGRFVMGGAIGDPPHGALLVFKVDDPATVEEFAQQDAYVLNGLVTARRIEPWAVV
jgi:uncharacterized protein YciI